MKPSPLSPEKAVMKRGRHKNPRRQRKRDPKPAPLPLSTKGAVVPSVDLLRFISAQVPVFVKDYVSNSTLEAKRGNTVDNSTTRTQSIPYSRCY